MITGFRSGLFALGFNLTRQTKPADIISLMRKLAPQNCGVDLIRIGGSGDGGYLIPNDLEDIEYCFSPGVSTVADFENDLASRRIRSFLADYSVDSPPTSRPEFTFDKKFLGSTDCEPFFTLQSWKNKYIKDYANDLILQMDIEGAEYEVILNTPDQLLNQFRILVIEFHRLDGLFDPFAFALYSSCFEKLLEFFNVVHIHPNNCCGSAKRGEIKVPRVMEFTFLNKRRVRSTKPQRTFPHKLDSANFPWKSLNLPKCWYSQG
jgi:hypothetical protein